VAPPSSSKVRSICFDADSTPPVATVSGAAVSHDELTLEAADGNRFAAFRAMPDRTAQTGIVILPDVRGLYRFYEEFALRFAERGFVAVAFDYFGRTAGASKRGEDFEYAEHVQQAKPGLVQEDVGTAVRDVRAVGCTSIFTVGFCFGGRHSWLAAASGHGLQGAVGFYGHPGERNGVVGPTQRVADIEAPILALQAGDDRNITARDNAQFAEALRVAGIEHEVITYAGAPHSFFDRKQEEFAEASADAWRRVMDFLAAHAR
jgi:carboxymethylenebutenolidase